MIDKTDTHTKDAFPSKKRGRPFTGAAMTPAERKRAQRSRDAKKIHGSDDYQTATLTGLLEKVSHLVTEKKTEQVKAITRELIRRSK